MWNSITSFYTHFLLWFLKKKKNKVNVYFHQMGGGGPQGDHPVRVRVHREDLREAPRAQHQHHQH